jgi:hypothetical protein
MFALVVVVAVFVAQTNAFRSPSFGASRLSSLSAKKEPKPDNETPDELRARMQRKVKLFMFGHYH